MNNKPYMYNYQNIQYDNRFIPGFWAPFLLGGVTGGLLAPAFYNNNKSQNSGYQLFYVPQPNNYGVPYTTTTYYY